MRSPSGEIFSVCMSSNTPFKLLYPIWRGLVFSQKWSLEGEAGVTATVTTGQTTDVTVAVQGAGAVKLSVSVDPESSLNPAYVIVK